MLPSPLGGEGQDEGGPGELGAERSHPHPHPLPERERGKVDTLTPTLSLRGRGGLRGRWGKRERGRNNPEESMGAQSDIAIRIRGLGKAYRIVHGQEKHTTLGEAIAHRIRHPFQRLQRETFWALRDVDLDIHRGDVVGIIGRNGAGKSTLLKVLSRITEPTTGEVDIYGRVGSLLEVGTGFHPELTGRENIFLNGAILGMKRREILRQFDAIVEFAGVEKFLDTPVKRYSSGMYVRLAFAVAAHLNPEILLVDEVLAVGDAEFQKKCLGKMKEVSTQQGRTVLFVSHNMAAVSNLCRHATWLKQGQVVRQGDAPEVVSAYAEDIAVRTVFDPESAQREGDGRVRVRNVRVEPTSPCTGAKVTFTIDLEKTVQEERLEADVAIAVLTSAGIKVLQLFTAHAGKSVILNNEKVQVQAVVEPLPLVAGTYRLNVWVGYGGVVFDWLQDCCVLDVGVGAVEEGVYAEDRGYPVILPCSWSSQPVAATSGAGR